MDTNSKAFSVRNEDYENLLQTIDSMLGTKYKSSSHSAALDDNLCGDLLQELNVLNNGDAFKADIGNHILRVPKFNIDDISKSNKKRVIYISKSNKKRVANSNL